MAAEADANSRLSEDDVARVIDHFAPGTPEPVKETEEPQNIEYPTADLQVSSPDETPTEVIRVAKVELQGLKVLGKIDLPAPKKKAEPAPETDQQKPRKEFQKRNERRDREWKNPIEAQRQREEREAEQRKREQAERLKEKRTNHYYNKVKSVPTKAVRRVEEPVVVEDIDLREPPKGLFGRFLRWLRS